MNKDLTEEMFLFFAEQLKEISRTTFSEILCMVTDLHKVPYNGFVTPTADNPYIDCSRMDTFNFYLFIDLE